MAEEFSGEEFSSSSSKQEQKLQVPNLGNAFFVPVILDPSSGMPMIPLYPTQMPDEKSQQGGLFVVPMFAAGAMDPVPLSYNAPLGFHPEGSDGTAAEAEEAARARPERHVVRRFRVGIQLDVLLIMKLATMVFIFSQDGSRDKLLLLFLAGVVYLYQTGALTPLIRWASERARRAMMPPMQVANAPPQDVPEDAPQAAAAVAGPAAPQDAPAEAQEAEAAADGEQQQLQQPQPQLQPQQAGFLREVQMFVIGLLTSLLPGFQNVD